MTAVGKNPISTQLSWMPGGGVVSEIHGLTPDWKLPSEATLLHVFHVTLIGRKAFLENQNTMIGAWDSLRGTLPSPRPPELETQVRLATDGGRKTWYLHIGNQEEFRSYVDELTRLLDKAFRRLDGCNFTNPESDRYFHMSIANNRGGDPLKSIGSIERPRGT
jgi:hypothetical protein